jgi:hypothetical protein
MDLGRSCSMASRYALAWLPARETTSSEECSCSHPMHLKGWGGGGARLLCNRVHQRKSLFFSFVMLADFRRHILGSTIYAHIARSNNLT